MIPARAGSKGLPGKNRKLLERTLAILPPDVKVWVSTDDPEIERQCSSRGINIHSRSKESASDEAPIKTCLQEWVEDIQPGENDLVVVLYLTYPQRTWDDVLIGIEYLKHHGASSLLCRYTVKDHPYLCFSCPTDRPECGSPLVSHTLTRRQDYPECFVASHYLIMFKVRELETLKPNLYNDNTVFMPIVRPIDVDTVDDLIQFKDMY